MSSARKQALPYGLRIPPSEAQVALHVLQGYVEERRKIIEDKKIEDVPSAVKLMHAINQFTEQLGKQVKGPAETLYNSMRFTVIPELMDAADITSIGVDGVGRVRLQDDITCKVEDKELLNKWLTVNELEDIITETVNAQTLAATLRQRIRATPPLPLPPITVVKITPVVRAQITKE